MIIQKSYKFYAAHRNALLDDKCRNLHGHRYGVQVQFQVQRDGHLTTLFSNFDDKVEPHLLEQYDHAMLIDRHDPLFPFLKMYEESTGDRLKLKILDFPTTVENIAFQLFTELTDFGFDVFSINVKETDSSEFIYTRADWIDDSRRTAELKQAQAKLEKV